MGERRQSRQELNRARRRDGFIGRHTERQSFYANLCRNAGEAHYLFHVHGVAGVGKSSLLRHWEGTARGVGALTAVVDEDVNGPVEAMEAISAQLARQGQVLGKFDAATERYRKHRHEADASLAGPAGASENGSASASSRTAAHLGIGALSLAPLIGPVSAGLDPEALARGTDRLRAAISSRLRNHQDVELVLHPLRVLTPVFVRDLAEAAEDHPWIVLFFDTWERTEPFLDAWLRSFVLSDSHGDLPVNVIVVISGQAAPVAREWSEYRDLVVDIELEAFTEAEARTLLTTRGVTDEALVASILHMSGRLPVLLDTLARVRPASADGLEDASETAVDRFLHWVSDPHRRAAILACALPLHVNEDVYRTIAPQEVATEYAWLRGLPFVSGQGGRCRYHDVVRTSMLRFQRTRSPHDWSEGHTHLAEAHARWRSHVERTLDPGRRWTNSDWREHRLNETYHRLCASPHFLGSTLEELVEACAEGLPVVRQWVNLLSRAGEDCASESLTTWGRRLESALGRDPITSTLTALITTDSLGPTARARAHQLRGRQYIRAARHADALCDFDAAHTLDPAIAAIHSDRGTALTWLRRFDEAVVDFGRAIELRPDDAWAFTRRGVAHRLDRHYEEAVVDFGRAIELRPDDAWAFAHRGLAHRLAGRYHQAITDLDHAIALNPDYAWALANRGEVHRLAGRYHQAITDLDHAIALDPDDAWGATYRGDVHQLSGRHDLMWNSSHATNVDPDYPWAIANRGVAHRLAGHDDRALTDLDHAIELDPGYGWAIVNRGHVHRRTGQHGQARSDFERALTIDPDKAEYLLNEAILTSTTEGLGAASDTWRSLAEQHGDLGDAYDLLAVFLASLITGSPGQSRIAFQRFILEEPSSDVTDDAVRFLDELILGTSMERDRVDGYHRALSHRLGHLQG
ncbi:tetratricopeptide repeat protein [Streptomyces sp. NPDC006464]|uniref:tetratricopeptide repeat protein n=1 Tax=Streptomyces sp. NPDC006464 TaxID=3154305 RepID=UPI00339FE61D